MNYFPNLIVTFFFLILTACNNYSSYSSNKIVETYFETAECIVGEWISEDKKEGNYVRMKFFAEIDPSEKHKYEGHRLYQSLGKLEVTLEVVDEKGSIVEMWSDDWKIKEVGIVKSDRFEIKLTNCNRFVLDGVLVFIKK